MLVQESCQEWQIPLAVSALDFKKAYDSISHSAIWESLTEQGVDKAYIQILAKLYEGQTAD
eukprot:6760592-Karenia_brevis.AAC.1